MKITNIEINFKDFKKTINNLKSCSDDDFETLQISELKKIRAFAQDVLKEWNFLENDVEDMISIINDIDDN